jgi:hypothetical protein
VTFLPSGSGEGVSVERDEAFGTGNTFSDGIVGDAFFAVRAGLTAKLIREPGEGEIERSCADGEEEEEQDYREVAVHGATW